MKTALSLVLLLLTTVVSAQNSTEPLRRSNVAIKAGGPNMKTIELQVGEATVYYNSSSGDVTIGFDINNYIVGDSLIDATAIAAGDATMEFKGNLGMSLYSLNEAKNDGKTYTMNGKLIYNNRDTLITAIFDPITFSGGGYDGTNSDLKINFKFNIDPSKFYMPGYTEKGVNALTFDIAPGLINNR